MPHKKKYQSNSKVSTRERVWRWLYKFDKLTPALTDRGLRNLQSGYLDP